jgi:MFS family permease
MPPGSLQNKEKRNYAHLENHTDHLLGRSIFFNYGLFVCYSFAPFYLQDLGVTDPSNLRLWSGLFASAAGLSMALVTPFWGYLADRVGKKPMTLRASLEEPSP